jgi:predicted ATP-grasp superfamily ATP-dependent carboligase
LFVASNGMDVARALYLDLTGQPMVASAAVEGRRWIVEDLDLVSSYRYYREGSLTIRGWLKSLRGIDEATFLSRRDPLPLFFMCVNRLQELCARAYQAVKRLVRTPVVPAPAAGAEQQGLSERVPAVPSDSL